MTHLRIELNTTGIELVSSAVIKKLYDLVYSGTLDNTSNIQGRLHVSSTYLSYITYLQNAFSNLYITADVAYVDFVDPVVEQICAAQWGDGIGCTSSLLLSVTTIPDSFFENNTDITSLNDMLYFTGVTTINHKFAYGATNLTSVTTPANLVNLSWYTNGSPEKGALSGCSNLSNVLLNEGLNHIGHRAFEDCTSLVSINIPSTVTELGYSITNSNNRGGRCFEDCNNLLTVTGGDSIQTIGYNCFCRCTPLTGILNINWSNVTYIDLYAFEHCNNFSASLTLSNLQFLGTRAFYETKVTSLDLTGSSITVIPLEAFYNCTSLTSISNLEGITEFGSSCFKGCSNLSVPIPSTLKILRSECVRGTNSTYTLQDLQGVEQFIGNRDNGIFGSSPYAALRFPYSGELYLPNCKKITGGTFKGTNITSINLPALEYAIDNYGAFADCSSLTTVTSLGNANFETNAYSTGVFENCTNLTTVTLPNTVTTLSRSLFSNCTNLATLNFDSTKVTKIGGSCFSLTNSLTNKVMYFPNVTDIETNNTSNTTGVRAFCNTSNMHIYLPKVTGTQKANQSWGSSGINSSWLAYRRLDSDSSQAVINTLYFRDITEFGAGTFYNATITNVIINNTTVPSIVVSSVGSGYPNKTSLDTNVFHGIKSIGSIYVPDTAVNDYKNAPQFASVASYIKPLSECPRITIQQAEQGSSGVIADYLV